MIGGKKQDSFEKLIDRLVGLTKKDEALWETHLGISRCRLDGVVFAIDNPQDGKPLFYVKDDLGKATVVSYKVRDLISAIYDKERRF
jgi:hypothetical protein